MKLILPWAVLWVLGVGCEIPLDRPAPRSDSGRRLDEERAGLSPKDPVCGATCIGDTCERQTFQDKQYSFCSKECRKKFNEHPEKYIDVR